VHNLGPLAKKHKTWYQSMVSAPNDGDKIRDATREMDEALTGFMVSFSLLHRSN
jgi:hypothetical protein